MLIITCLMHLYFFSENSAEQLDGGKLVLGKVSNLYALCKFISLLNLGNMEQMPKQE